MRILGIDPGLRFTGFGVMDVQGSTLACVASGTISTLHLAKAGPPARVKLLFNGVCEVAHRYRAGATSMAPPPFDAAAAKLYASIRSTRTAGTGSRRTDRVGQVFQDRRVFGQHELAILQRRDQPGRAQRRRGCLQRRKA